MLSRFAFSEITGLTVPDRQGVIVVSLGVQPGGDKTMARHPPHHAQHLGVRDVAAAELTIDHPPPGFLKPVGLELRDLGLQRERGGGRRG